jgi:hypothetical protein
VVNIDPESFIVRWQHADGSELANAQRFTRELRELLEVPAPDPARADTAENAYVYERRVIFRHGDGSTSEGRIDCYRRGAFVLEAKKLRQGPQSKGFDDGMLRARAENYARNLPAEEGRPPFLIVVDVGNVIELYAEFSRSGAPIPRFPTRVRTASGWPTCARRRSARACGNSGWTRSPSTPAASPPASPARFPAAWPMSRASWKAPGTIPNWWPASSPAACSACSPRMSACCRNGPSPSCWKASWPP